MKNDITLNDLYPEIINKLNSGGEFRFTPNGISMYPMLSDGENEVVIGKAEDISVGDVVLCKTEDGGFILHRVDEIRNGGYILRGDNPLKREGIFNKDSVVGKMLGYYKNGKYISANSRYYIRYTKTTLPLHRLKLRIKRKCSQIIKGSKNGD